MSKLLGRVIRDNYNHGFGDLGDEKPPPGVLHEVEDRLIQVLDDCVTGPNSSNLTVNLRPFREWLRGYDPQRCGWNEDNRTLCLMDDQSCEATIHFTICKLKRLSHLQEWSANWLLKQGIPIGMLPDGQDYLRR